MIVMVIISFANLLGLKIAGISVIIGVVFFFINDRYEKQPTSDSGLDFKTIGANLKDKGIWIWILLPIIMDAVSITIAKIFLPEYIGHVLSRTEVFVSFDKVFLMLFQLAFLALGEEIAWRAFFQKQLNKVFSIIHVLLISSVLFAIGHFNQGNPVIVTYDIFFVFINSILYGIIFYKSKNAWISAISHFAANLFSVIVLVFI
jgi:membrane protease YdiL (CAAX protease family)